MTGATGLIGSHVAERLRAGGHPVRALVRDSSDTSFLEAIGCELVRGDVLEGPDTFTRAMGGCEAVIHSAAVIYAELPWPRVRAVNVTGAENVFRGAARAGLRRGIHLSSVAVYGDPRGVVDEATPTDGPLRPYERYARSKRESEAAVERIAEESGMAVTTLRPAAVYGERDRLFAPKMARALKLPVQVVLGPADSPIPVVYAGSVAGAVTKALQVASVPGVRVFNLAEDEPTTQEDVYRYLAEGMGRKARLVRLPERLVLAGARVGELLRFRIRGAEELPLMRAARLAVGRNPYRSTRIRDALGWSPELSREEALRRTGRWLAPREGATMQAEVSEARQSRQESERGNGRGHDAE